MFTPEIVEKYSNYIVLALGLFVSGATAATTEKIGIVPGVSGKIPKQIPKQKSKTGTKISKKASHYSSAARSLMKLLADARVQAFLKVLRYAEGTPKPEHYFVTFGYVPFTDVSQKPRKVIVKKTRSGKIYRSSAAGAYQINNATWDEIQKHLALPDFSPLSQDIAALWLIAKRGKALNDILAGDLREALRKCRKIWASLPDSPYGQPTKKYEKLAQIWLSELQDKTLA